MISGECRVEPIGLTTGHRLALEGLRLRLDLRIVPGSLRKGAVVEGAVSEGSAGGTDAAEAEAAAGTSPPGEDAAAAVWRIEDWRIRTLPLGGVPAVYRRAAMAAGVSVVALALIVWWAGSGTQSETPLGDGGRGSATIITTVTHAPPAASGSGAGTAEGAAGAAVTGGRSSAAWPSPVTASPLAPHARSPVVSPTPSASATAASELGASTGVAPVPPPPFVAPPTPTSRAAAHATPPRPAATRSAALSSSDMLELFNDTK